MQYEDYLTHAIEIVSALDISEEQLADAINQQAMLMSGVPPEEIPDTH